MPRRPLLAVGLAVAALLPMALPPAHAGPTTRLHGQRLASALRGQKIRTATFDQVTLPALVKWLRLATGANFVVKHRALAKAGIDAKDITFTADLEDVTVATLLGLALEPHDLVAQIRGNVVYITTRADSQGKPVTRLYAISHITYRKVDFIAPSLDLRPSDFVAADDYEPERLVEDDPLSDGDSVAELVQELVAAGQWENEGWSIRATQRHLVVRAPRAVQRQIPRVLAAIASMK